VAARVADARALAAERLARAGAPDRRTNAEIEGDLLDATCARDPDAEALLQNAAQRLKLSARGYHRTLRVARTIADLAGAARIARPHVAEALSYRRRAQR
jgi:magnesium chelatase family protein